MTGASRIRWNKTGLLPLHHWCIRSYLVDNFASLQHVKPLGHRTILNCADIIHFVYNHGTEGVLLNQDLCCRQPVLQALVLVDVIVVGEGPAIWQTQGLNEILPWGHWDIPLTQLCSGEAQRLLGTWTTSHPHIWRNVKDLRNIFYSFTSSGDAIRQI